MKWLIPIFFILLISCRETTFSIPTSSMEGTLPYGSYIIVDKFNEIKRNDIIVYNINDNYFVFRLVGMPGDTMELIDSEIFINNKKQEYPSTIQHSYFVSTKRKNLQKLFGKYNVNKDDISYFHFSNSINITQSTYNRMNNDIDFDTIYRNIKEKGEVNESLFADFSKMQWNEDNFGPLYIPKKDDKIHLNEFKGLYNSIIQKYKVGFSLNKSEYTFKKNYAFVMGDNRNNAADSRYIGFIPFESIIGSVIIFNQSDD